MSAMKHELQTRFEFYDRAIWENLCAASGLTASLSNLVYRGGKTEGPMLDTPVLSIDPEDLQTYLEILSDIERVLVECAVR